MKFAIIILIINVNNSLTTYISKSNERVTKVN